MKRIIIISIILLAGVVTFGQNGGRKPTHPEFSSIKQLMIARGLPAKIWGIQFPGDPPKPTLANFPEYKAVREKMKDYAKPETREEHRYTGNMSPQ